MSEISKCRARRLTSASVIRRSVGPFVIAIFLTAHAASGAILEDVFRQGYDVSATAKISIRNTDGRIFIYGGDQPRLEIHALRRAFTKERLDAIKVNVAIEGERVAIDTVYPPLPQGSRLADRSGTVDYTLIVPQHATLSEVTLANGEVMIDGMRGAGLEAKLDRGVLSLRDCFSHARVRLGEGKLNVFFGWWERLAFSLSAEVNRGDLRLGLPWGAALRLDALAEQGRVINRIAPEPSEREPSRLQRTLGDGGEVEFTLRATNGDVWIDRAF